MAERTVKVNLVAQVNGYIAGMEAAALRTRALGSEAEKLAAKKQAFADLGRPLLAFGAIAAVAVGLAIKKFADFDVAMSNVKAVTNATTSEMNLLREAALDAGGRTIYTATEAAGALEELGKAGFSTAESIEALDGTLSLASAGQLEVARSAEIVATTIKQYGLEFSDAAHVSDVFAAAAGKALGSVEDIAQAMKFVGPVAASMGVSLEETAGALALFADQGLIGEQAGTSLRGVLSSLTSPSKEAKAEIDRLGISLYDGNGKFKGLTSTAGELEDAFKGLDDKSRDAALGIIFGNQQVTAARVLFAKGADGVASYTAKVNDAGYAAKIAADRLDNLAGDVEKLSGSLDTALIREGSSANEVLRSLVQTATYFVDEIGDAPAPVLATGLALTTLTAAVALSSGAFLTFGPRVLATKAALNELGISFKSAALSAGSAGLVIGGLTLLLADVASKQARIAATGDALVDSIDKTTGFFTDYSRELVRKELLESGAAKTAEQFGVSLDTLTNAAFGNADALREYNEKVGSIATGGIGGAAKPVRDLTNEFNGLRTEIGDAPGEFADMQEATESAGDSYESAAAQVAAMQSELSQLIDTINAANGIGQDAVAANATYQASINSTAAAVSAYTAANGVSTANIDESTEAGSANAEMFADLAKKSQVAAQAQFDLDGSVGNYTDTLSAGRQNLYDQIFLLTGSADAAQLLTDKVYAIPSSKEVDILADTSSAQYSIDRFITLNSGRKVKLSVNGGPGFASGGYTGSGGVSEPAGVVHRGEFVSTAATTRNPSNRAALEYMHRGGTIAGYAGGGYVSAASPSWAPSGAASGKDTLASEIRALRRDILRQPMVVEIGNQAIASANRSNDRSLRGSRG